MSGIEFSRDDDHLLPRDDEDDEDEATDEMMLNSLTHRGTSPLR